MQILPFDYFTGRPDPTKGLVQLADQIVALKSDPGVPTLLFDVGDFLQGNPLADTIANTRAGGGKHPMIAAFDALQYDAVALGNHEFNYGLPFLRAALRDASFPVLCANIDWRKEVPCAQPYVILDRQIHCSDGQSRAIRVGVLGLVPPQITQWDRPVLQGAIGTNDMVAIAQKLVPKIKAQGADIIVALCHTGIGAPDHVACMDNAAIPLAAVPDIDVMLTGHKHEIFPDPSRKPTSQVDPVKGRIHGKPTLSAGFQGNRLGMITLDLIYDGAAGWQIKDHYTSLIAASNMKARSAVSRQIAFRLRPYHAATLARLRRKIAQTVQPIHNFFAAVTADAPRDMLATALIADAAVALPGLDLPLIAVVAPFRAGGRAGATDYVHIPAGSISKRDICAIYPYADAPVVVRQTGQALRDWLEQAVSGYCQIAPGIIGQPLFNPLFPAYMFDALYGLTYAIDLTRPARHDSAGNVIAADASRVTDLRHQGRPVRSDDVFAIVVNSYRAFGGGGFLPVPETDILHLSDQRAQDVLTKHLRKSRQITIMPRNTWRFAPITGARAVFRSAPQAQRYIQHPIRHLGPGKDGFHDYELIL